MELSPEKALEQDKSWLAYFHRSHPTPAIRGAAGAGKAALLRGVANIPR